MLHVLPRDVLPSIARSLDQRSYDALRMASVSLNAHVWERQAAPAVAAARALQDANPRRWLDFKERVAQALRSSDHPAHHLVMCLSVCSMKELGFSFKSVMSRFDSIEWVGVASVFLSACAWPGGGDAARRAVSSLSPDEINTTLALVW